MKMNMNISCKAEKYGIKAAKGKSKKRNVSVTEIDVPMAEVNVKWS